jgi:single-strand selective monofunctional uracil DNA glycosylase
MSSARLVDAAQALAQAIARLEFAPPVGWVYHPLLYAWEPHRLYLERYGNGRKRVLFLGMNPGPWGMAQTGVPFGAVAMVRDFLHIQAAVGQPERPHPRCPVQGLDCRRNEVSGQRLWSLFGTRFETAERFFADHFVTNYCPVMMLDESGKNLTPDKLRGPVSLALEAACDQHLRAVVQALGITTVVGVGAYAEKVAQRALAGSDLRFGRMPHPSPANPAANRDWAGAARQALTDQGIWPPR